MPAGSCVGSLWQDVWRGVWGDPGVTVGVCGCVLHMVSR
jgi:hypothetical protein